MIKYHPVTIKDAELYPGELIVRICGESVNVFATEIVAASAGRGFIQGTYIDGRFTVEHLGKTSNYTRETTTFDVNPNDLYDMRAVCC